MSTYQHPTAVVIPVGGPDRRAAGRRWAPAFSRRLDVDVQAETAPKPVMSYSEFHGVGRDAAHATPHMWRYQGLSIADKLSIAGWPFLVKTALSAVYVPGSSIGGMNPVQERTQIIQPKQESLSSRAAVYPEPYFSPGYMKIM